MKLVQGHGFDSRLTLYGKHCSAELCNRVLKLRERFIEEDQPLQCFQFPKVLEQCWFQGRQPIAGKLPDEQKSLLKFLQCQWPIQNELTSKHLTRGANKPVNVLGWEITYKY